MDSGGLDLGPKCLTLRWCSYLFSPKNDLKMLSSPTIFNRVGGVNIFKDLEIFLPNMFTEESGGGGGGGGGGYYRILS